MRSYLVVANQTLGGEHLIQRVRQCLAEGPCRYHIVVPATPQGELLTWTEGRSTRRRLRSIGPPTLSAMAKGVTIMRTTISVQIGIIGSS